MGDAALKRIRCTSCGADFADVAPDQTVFVCERAGCGASFLLTQGEAFASVEKQRAEVIGNHRQALRLALLNRDIDSIGKYASVILGMIPGDFRAELAMRLKIMKQGSGDPRPLRNFLDSTPEGTPDEFLEMFPFALAYSGYGELGKLENAARRRLSGDTLLEARKKIEERRQQLEQNNDDYADIPRDVFICHSSQNPMEAEATYRALREDGWRVWISSHNLDPNTLYYWEDIEQAIRQCRIFLVLCTRDAMLSPDVQREMKMAGDARNLRLELKLDDAPHTAYFKIFFNGITWIDARKSVDSALERLNSIVAKLIYPEPVPPEPETVPPEPVAVPPEPVTVPPEPVTIPPEPVPVPPEPETVPPEPVPVPPEPETVPPEPVTVPPEPVAVPPEPVPVPPEPVTAPPEPVTVPPEPPVAVPPEPVTVPPEPETVPPEPVTVPPEPVTVPPEPVPTPPGPETAAKESIYIQDAKQAEKIVADALAAIEQSQQEQAELERQRQVELERQSQLELERQRQLELERQLQLELEWQQQLEFERLARERLRLFAWGTLLPAVAVIAITLIWLAIDGGWISGDYDYVQTAIYTGRVNAFPVVWLVTGLVATVLWHRLKYLALGVWVHVLTAIIAYAGYFRFLGNAPGFGWVAFFHLELAKLFLGKGVSQGFAGWVILSWFIVETVCVSAMAWLTRRGRMNAETEVRGDAQ